MIEEEEDIDDLKERLFFLETVVAALVPFKTLCADKRLRPLLLTMLQGELQRELPAYAAVFEGVELKVYCRRNKRSEVVRLVKPYRDMGVLIVVIGGVE